MEFLLLLVLLTTNVAMSKAFTCDEGWLQGPRGLDENCYVVLGAEVEYYPQYMSFYQCKQACNEIGGKKTRNQ